MPEAAQIAEQANNTDRYTGLFLRAGLGLLCAVLIWNLSAFLAYLRTALFFPYSLDYGEGIVWQQMRNMLDGTAFGPLSVYPAVVYHYPPIYHLASAAMAGLINIDQLLAGRIVSVISTFATAYMVGLLTARSISAEIDARVRTICAMVAGLLFLNCYPVVIWAPLMRVDMLSGALEMAGILLTLRALQRPSWIYGAALMFVLAVYTKQTSIAAPMAAFSALLLVRPALAVRGAVVSAFLGLFALGWLSWATNGGFLTHILLYNINRFSPLSFGGILIPLLIAHMMLIALAIIGAAASWAHLRRVLAGCRSLALVQRALDREPATVGALTMLLFLGIKTIMLLGILKSGASINYMIGWFSVVAVFAGLALAPVVARGIGCGREGENPSVVHLALALVALPIQLAHLSLIFPDAQVMERDKQGRARIVELIATSSRPVISDDMTLLIRAGRNVEWEPAITAELGHLGKYDQVAFARLIHAHCFDFFVVEGKLDRSLFLARYNPPVAQAILTEYPREERISEFTLRWPVTRTENCPLDRSDGQNRLGKPNCCPIARAAY